MVAFCPINPQEAEYLDVAVSAAKSSADAAKTSADEAKTAAQAVDEINIDSTGGQLSVAKALEVIVARCVGNLSYQDETGVASFLGRDGQTAIATVKLTGGGNRTESSIR